MLLTHDLTISPQPTLRSSRSWPGPTFHTHAPLIYEAVVIVVWARPTLCVRTASSDMDILPCTTPPALLTRLTQQVFDSL